MNILLKNGHYTIIDVRSPDEFAKGHVPGALNIPLEDIPERVIELMEMPRPIIAYCRSGNRSRIAISLLKLLGVDDVYNGGSWYDMLRSAQ